MQMSDEETLSVQPCLDFRSVGQGLWICIFFPDIRSEADLGNWQYDSCFAEKCASDLWPDQAESGTKCCFSVSWKPSCAFGVGTRNTFVVGDVGELERYRTKSWKSLRVCLPSSQSQARFPGAGTTSPPPTTTTFIIPLDLRHLRYPRMALFPWRVSQKWRSDLAKKGLLHCKETHTPTVHFFSFNPTVLQRVCTGD